MQGPTRTRFDTHAVVWYDLPAFSGNCYYNSSSHGSQSTEEQMYSAPLSPAAHSTSAHSAGVVETIALLLAVRLQMTRFSQRHICQCSRSKHSVIEAEDLRCLKHNIIVAGTASHVLETPKVFAAASIALVAQQGKMTRQSDQSLMTMKWSSVKVPCNNRSM